MKTAVIQFNATANKENNITKAVSFIKQAARKKATFILLPEVFVYRGSLKSEHMRQQIAETIPGEATKRFSALASELAVNLLLGSIYERSRHRTKLYNTSILIDKKGNIVQKYRKMNLFKAIVGRKRVEEADLFLRGNKLGLAEVDGFKIGLSVCFDVRFSQLYQKYADRGAHIFCVPSAFTRITGQAHWKILLKARAIENFCYVVAPNQIGQDQRGIKYYGHSMIINPWGEIISEASGNKEEIIYGTIDRGTIKEIRKKIVIR